MKFLKRGMKMVIVSSYPPRECGLATFSMDIVKAIAAIFGTTLPVEICALQNENTKLKYSTEVTSILRTSHVENYRKAAHKINERDDVGLVCIQHEFGLFGGVYGEYLLGFLLALDKPVITIFHSVIPNPDEKRKIIVQTISNLSDKIVVLTDNSKDILMQHYDCSKIKVIPHGTHTVLWDEKEKRKLKHNYAGKTILSTFGLISANKSIETVLYALPEIVSKYPEVRYLVIGKTHPEVVKQEGEKYRNTLKELVQKLDLESHVVFIDCYLKLKQLLDYLTLSDIYLFTSKDPLQAVSGTLCYAMACGCAVIANPIPHAEEIVHKDTGILLEEFDNTSAFQKAITELLDDKQKQLELSKNAFSKSQANAWENTAIQYGLVFGELTNRTEDLRFNLPPIKLDHIKALTTDVGILQFSKFCKPDPNSGYTIDDNARALINMVMYHENYADENVLNLADIYLNFIEGMQRDDGWFDNYKNFDGQLTNQNQEVNLEDANGRVLWSLGYVIAHKKALPVKLVLRALKCWNKALPNIVKIHSPRAVAYAIKGLYHYHTIFQDQNSKELATELAAVLLHHYKINSNENWNWYEEYMAYANNVLPEAMMYSYLITDNTKFKEISEITLDFLLANYFMKGQLKIISNKKWFKKKNEKEFYGEQPIEVATTMISLDLFYKITKKKKYKNQLELAFSWFLGNNHLKQIMYNPINGGAYDGLEDKNININQGAESALCFFKAQILMNQYLEKKSKDQKDKNKWIYQTSSKSMS